MSAEISFNDYQQQIANADIGPFTEPEFLYQAMGLAEESGEVVGKLKNIVRDKNGQVSPEDCIEIKKELGDTLWYLARIASELEITMSDVAQTNLEKIYDRLERGVVSGSGDNR